MSEDDKVQSIPSTNLRLQQCSEWLRSLLPSEKDMPTFRAMNIFAANDLSLLARENMCTGLSTQNTFCEYASTPKTTAFCLDGLKGEQPGLKSIPLQHVRSFLGLER